MLSLSSLPRTATSPRCRNTWWHVPPRHGCLDSWLLIGGTTPPPHLFHRNRATLPFQTRSTRPIEPETIRVRKGDRTGLRPNQVVASIDDEAHVGTRRTCKRALSSKQRRDDEASGIPWRPTDGKAPSWPSFGSSHVPRGACTAAVPR